MKIKVFNYPILVKSVNFKQGWRFETYLQLMNKNCLAVVLSENKFEVDPNKVPEKIKT